MQSHNGDIELSVTLSTKGIESDAKKIKQEIEKDLSKTDVKVDLGAKKETEEYKQLNKELEHLNQMRDKLINKQQDMLAVGKQESKPFKDADAQIEALGKTIEQVKADMQELVNSGRAFEEVEDETAKEMARLQAILDRNREIREAEAQAAEEVQEITQAEADTAPSYSYPTLTADNLEEETRKIYDEINGTKEATDSVVDSIEEARQNTQAALESIQAYKSGMQNTEDVAKDLAYDLKQFDAGFRYSDEFVQLKKDSDSLTKQFNNITSKLREMEMLGEEDSEKYQQMALKAATIADALRDVNGQMSTMRDSGTAYVEGFDEAEYINVERHYNILADKLSLMRHEVDETEERTVDYSRVLNRLSNSISNIIRTGLGRLPNLFRRITSSIVRSNRQITRLDMSFKQMLGYAIGINSLLSLFNKLRGAITNGIQNLAKWRDGNNRANESLSTLTSTLQWMKNAWGAAFEPILTYVTPVLDTLISKIAEVANAISYMMAKLTGQSTWMKAIRVQKDYAKSLSGTGSAAKEAEEGLAQYDKLVMVNKQNAGGGANANADIDDMFEEMSMDDAVDWVDDFLAKIKEAWEKADFTDIGNIIGEWLKNALDSIPWKEIQAFAKKLAHSLATLLNGFFETEGLGTSIGKTIAEALKTAFMFVNEFVHTLHWDSIGRFIADALLAIFEDEELFKEAGEAIGGTIRGFIDLIWAALDEFTENDGFTKVGQRIADFVNSVLAELNAIDEDGLTGWEKLGQSISMSVEGLLDTISTALAETDWHSLANGIVQVLENIDWLEILDKLNNVASNLLKAIAEAIKGITDEGVKGALATAIALVIAGLVITIDTVTLMILAATVLLGFNLGELIGEALFPEDAVWYKEFSWSDIFGETDFRSIVEGMIELLSDLGSGWDKLGESNLRYIPVLGGVLQIISLASGSIAKFYSIVLQLILFVIDNLPKVWEKMQEFSDKYVEFWWGGENSIYGTIERFLQKYIDFWWGENGVWDNIKKFENDIDFWFPEMVESIKGFFADCLFWIDDFFNNTLEYAENFGGDLELVLNNIIGFIEQVINSAIDGINALLGAIGSIDLDFSGLPAAIQDKIGTGISFDLPTLSHVSIPRLAQGAVIPPNKEFLAMLGDQTQGVNIETPLETMMEAFRAVLEENRNNEPIVLQLNGKVIAQAVWDEERKKYKQTGSYAY